MVRTDREPTIDMPSTEKRAGKYLVGAVFILTGIGVIWATRNPAEVQQDVAPTETSVETSGPTGEVEIPLTRQSSISEVLELATKSRDRMESALHDYTAHFVQQERDESGKLGERTECRVKIQTRMRNETNDAPMRIYIKFLKPDATAGREVIWGKDLYDGNMAVHETSLLLSWKTIWLNPTGMIAMAGQKYPIYEIGLVRLVEQLIERGQRDVNNPETEVTITRDHEFDGRLCELIQVTHATPSGEEDDFSLAEIVYDPEKLLILSYRSFGWLEENAATDQPPLLEFYQYLDLNTNVGLTDQDFDVANEAYNFPK